MQRSFLTLLCQGKLFSEGETKPALVRKPEQMKETRGLSWNEPLVLVEPLMREREKMVETRSGQEAKGRVHELQGSEDKVKRPRRLL